MDHLMDVSRALNSNYWLFSEDDFSLEFKEAGAAVWNCIGRMGPEDWPVVFKSDDGRVLIRSLEGAKSSTFGCERSMR